MGKAMGKNYLFGNSSIISITFGGGNYGKVLFAAFTGKAACVMRSKGCNGATTIHSLIYKARDNGEETPSFELWHEAPASKAKLIVVDECSMVDAELAHDLMSFQVPLLVLGDPAQLPPIQGGGSHRRCARRHAYRGPPAGAGRSHCAAVNDDSRRQYAAGRPLRRDRGGEARCLGARARDKRRPGSRGPQCDAARL